MPRQPSKRPYKLTELNLVLAFYEALDQFTISHEQKEAIMAHMRTKIEYILPETGAQLNEEADDIRLDLDAVPS